MRFRFSSLPFQQSHEDERAKERYQGGNRQRRMWIDPVIPVSNKKPYARGWEAKSGPERGNSIAQADGMSVFRHEMRVA
jgi:hypothetical protein